MVFLLHLRRCKKRKFFVLSTIRFPLIVVVPPEKRDSFFFFFFFHWRGRKVVSYPQNTHTILFFIITVGYRYFVKNTLLPLFSTTYEVELFCYYLVFSSSSQKATTRLKSNRKSSQRRTHPWPWGCYEAPPYLLSSK